MKQKRGWGRNTHKNLGTTPTDGILGVKTRVSSLAQEAQYWISPGGRKTLEVPLKIFQIFLLSDGRGSQETGLDQAATGMVERQAV